MAKYKITEISKSRTSTGKDKADVTLDYNVKATMWGDFPGFMSLEVGNEIEANLTPAKDPKYKPSLSPVTATTFNGGAYRRSGGANEEVRAKNIEKAQDRKSESIAYFNSVNSAIALFNGDVTRHSASTEEIKQVIVAWRDWFLDEYKKWNESPF